MDSTITGGEDPTVARFVRAQCSTRKRGGGDTVAQGGGGGRGVPL